MAKREKAKVSKRAGTTRGIQWIKAGSLLVLDSPGVIPFEDKEISLGVLGAKDPEKLRNVERAAFEIIKIFLDYNRKSLEDLYGIKIEGNDYSSIFEEIGRKKGFLLKGGIVDERRVAFLILKDWHKGKLRF